MRITCPSCASEYDVGATLAAGRIVRCARCGHEWAPVPAAPRPAPPVVEVMTPPSVMEEATPPSPRPFMVVPADARPDTRPPAAPRGTGLALAWIGSAALILALLAGGYVFRAPIMQSWPPSTRLYSALGLA